MRSVITLLLIVTSFLPITAFNQKAAVRVVRDLDFIAGTDYAENRDKLDLYPARRPQPVSGDRFDLWRRAVRRARRAVKPMSDSVSLPQASAQRSSITASRQRFSHPAHIQDAAAAFAWVKQHIIVRRDGGDPQAIFVIGQSAGAYLARCSRLMNAISPRTSSPHDIRGVVPVSAFLLC